MKNYMNIQRCVLKNCLLFTLLVLPFLSHAEVVNLETTKNLPAWTQVASTCTVSAASLQEFSTAGPKLQYQNDVKSRSVQKSPDYIKYFPLTAGCNVLNPLDGINGDLKPADDKFSPGKIGSNENPNWNVLIVGYSDPDGEDTSYQVVAKLYQVHRPTGTTSVVTTFDSNLEPVASWDTPSHPRERMKKFKHVWDYGLNAYYVEIRILRKSLVRNPSVYSLRLTEALDLQY